MTIPTVVLVVLVLAALPFAIAGAVILLALAVGVIVWLWRFGKDILFAVEKTWNDIQNGDWVHWF
jgi:hypothetical protein